MKKRQTHDLAPYILLIALIPSTWWLLQISFWYGLAIIICCALLAQFMVPKQRAWYEEPSYLDMVLGTIVISCSVALSLKLLSFLAGLPIDLNASQSLNSVSHLL